MSTASGVVAMGVGTGAGVVTDAGVGIGAGAGATYGAGRLDWLEAGRIQERL